MKHIYNFGCPRSGTTFIRRCLESLNGVSVHKIPEENPLHPINSKNGLIGLAKLHKGDILFIRTIRKPLDMIQSFYMFRLKEYKDVEFVRTDHEMLDMILTEEASFNIQVYSEDFYFPVITIDYDQFHLKEYRKIIGEKILDYIDQPKNIAMNRDVLFGWFSKFKAQPISIGRLQEKRLDQDLVDPIKLKNFKKMFNEISERFAV